MKCEFCDKDIEDDTFVTTCEECQDALALELPSCGDSCIGDCEHCNRDLPPERKEER